MQKIGRDKTSTEYWRKHSDSYGGSLSNDYHRHRLTVIEALIPRELLVPGRRVFDFGCGDAVHFPMFLEAGAEIAGLDISEEMIGLGRMRLRTIGYAENLIRVATVEALKELETQSLDGLLSFNVLAYLTNDEERLFYEQASRAVKPGGYLIVTHSNELFDMFSLNRYTAEFFMNNLIGDEASGCDVASLLSASDTPEQAVSYNVRENPLSYRFKLRQFGFAEEYQEFINLHSCPPPLIQGDRIYHDTLGLPEPQRWKLMFTCSTFGSLSRKVTT